MTATPDRILMRFPFHFKFNEMTAESNKFQSKVSSDLSTIQNQFKDAVDLIQENNIEVIYDFPPNEQETPDEVFPNNWFSTTPSKELILYPMAAKNRRQERHPDIIAFLQKEGYNSIIDLSSYEKEGKFLEGTGSILFDHHHKVAFACVSERTDLSLLHLLCQKMGYQNISFLATDLKGFPIYHTNVVMSIGEAYCVICLDAIENSMERKMVELSIKKLGKTVIEITPSQMNAFCGNIFEVNNRQGKKTTLMSTTAYNAFSETQKKEISKTSPILPIDVSLIEAIGGGSMRCMVAGLY